MMLGIMAELVNKLGLGCFPMLEFVSDAWRGGYKVTKIRVEGIICESNQDVRA